MHTDQAEWCNQRIRAAHSFIYCGDHYVSFITYTEHIRVHQTDYISTYAKRVVVVRVKHSQMCTRTHKHNTKRSISFLNRIAQMFAVCFVCILFCSSRVRMCYATRVWVAHVQRAHMRNSMRVLQIVGVRFEVYGGRRSGWWMVIGVVFCPYACLVCGVWCLSVLPAEYVLL